jgi:hypothetical protein
MPPDDRYQADQQFGAEAARDEERADAAVESSSQPKVATDIERKEPRAGNKAEPVEDE